MSFPAIAWAMEQTHLTRGGQHLLGRLANHLNEATRRCDPSVKRLATDSRCSERTIQKDIAELEAAGAISVTRRPGKRISFVLHYRQTLAEVAGVAGARPRRTPADFAEKPPRTPAESAPEPVQEDSNQEEEEREGALARAPAPSSPGDQNLPVKEGSPPKRPSPWPQQRGSPLSDDWCPTADDRAFATARGLDPPEVMLAFATYYRGTGGIRADWSNVFRSWCMRERKLHPPGRQTRQNSAAAYRQMLQQRASDLVAGGFRGLAKGVASGGRAVP